MTDGWLLLTIAVFAIFILDWLAVGYSWKRIEWVLKPLSMVLVIVWTWTVGNYEGDLLLVMLLSAQIFGLAGDILLLWRDRWFLWGLVSFLVGHLFYLSIMIGLLLRLVGYYGVREPVLWWVAVCILFGAVLLTLFYWMIAPHHLRVTMPTVLRISVQVYGWILSSLVILSILVVLSKQNISILFLALPLGSILFMISDSLLALDRFKRKTPKMRKWIMISYHLAQFSLAAGILSIMKTIRG